MNYSDPLGGYSRSIGSDIRIAHVDRPGSRWNALAELQSAAGNFIFTATKEDILQNVYSFAYTCGMTAMPYVLPELSFAFILMGYYDSYDKCRMAGLGKGASFGIALASCLLSNVPYENFSIDKSPIKDLGLTFAAQGLEDVLIAWALDYVSPAEQIRNRQTYCNNKSASIAVGGGLRYMYTDYTGIRRDLFGNP